LFIRNSKNNRRNKNLHYYREESFVVLCSSYNVKKSHLKENLVGLSTERTALSQTGTTTSRLAQDGGTRRAQNNSLSVAEDSRDVQTTYGKMLY
jgi:hypothetical protein